MSLWTNILARLKAAPSGQSGMLARLTPYSEASRRGTRELGRAHRTQPWPRAVVGRIAGDTAAVQWKLYAGEGDKRQEIHKHPFLDLVARPNAQMRGFEAIEFLQAWLDYKGEVFIVVERGQNGMPVALYPVPPHWIAETPTPQRPFFRGSFGTWQAELPIQDVIWIRHLDLENPYGRGAGTGEALSDEIDTDEFAAKRTKNFFYNNASPEVLVSAEGMNKEDAKAAKEKWEADHRGFWNAFRTFWTSAKLSVTRLDTSFKDMQLVELRASTRDTIIAVFGVPPEKMGIVENSNRATIDSADYLYAKQVLVPRLRRLAPVFADLLEQFPKSEGLAYEFENPVTDDGEFTLRVMQARPTAFTDNEVRKLARLPAAKGKDEFPQPTAFGAPLALAGDPEWTRSLPPRRKAADGGFGDNDIPRVLEALRPERLIAELQPVFERRIEAWAKDQLAGLGASGKFDLLNPLIPKYLDELATTKIKGLVDETTRTKLRDSLSGGVRAGESIDDLLDRVEDLFSEADTVRAEAIARTEVVGASNWATLEAQRASGVVATRAWVATRDGRTRETHLALDGKEATLHERFEVDGHSALYPGGFGVAAEDVNCRCTTVAVIDDDLEDDERAVRPRVKALATVVGTPTTAQLDETWKAYDAELVPWEAEATRALRRGFRQQLADVRKALRA